EETYCSRLETVDRTSLGVIRLNLGSWFESKRQNRNRSRLRCIPRNHSRCRRTDPRIGNVMVTKLAQPSGILESRRRSGSSNPYTRPRRPQDEPWHQAIDSRPLEEHC